MLSEKYENSEIIHRTQCYKSNNSFIPYFDMFSVQRRKKNSSKIKIIIKINNITGKNKTSKYRESNSYHVVSASKEELKKKRRSKN